MACSFSRSDLSDLANVLPGPNSQRGGRQEEIGAEPYEKEVQLRSVEEIEIVLIHYKASE